MSEWEWFERNSSSHHNFLEIGNRRDHSSYVGERVPLAIEPLFAKLEIQIKLLRLIEHIDMLDLGHWKETTLLVWFLCSWIWKTSNLFLSEFALYSGGNESMTGTRWQSILYICDTVSALLVEKFQFRWFFLNKIDLSHDNQYILIHLGVLSYYMWFICVKKKENWLGFIKGCESLYHKNNSLIVSGVLHAWRKCIENCLSFSSKVYCVMPWNLKIKTLFGNYFLK